MIEKLYSEYDSDITIRAEVGKTFNENRLDLTAVGQVEGAAQISRALEEVVILKHEQKWSNANLIGVDTTFLKMSEMSSHMIDGAAYLYADANHYGIIGATLLDKLNGYIPENSGHEALVCYVPKRNVKIRLGKNPFKTEVIKIAGRCNFNREVNAQSFVVSLGLAREMMGYTNNQISALYINCSEGVNSEFVKQRLIDVIGEGFVVKTNYEKNELIYKTSKSEKIIVLIILLFIFILAAFNLVASLTMLFVEKLANVKTMLSYGASRSLIFRIFFYEGMLISGKGIFIGAFVGYAICFIQMYFNVVTMPNSGGEAFPMNVSVLDGAIILSLVSILSILFSFIPVKYLIHKNINA
ncbi:MAG: hypothetical protein P8N52_01475 [Crocinitomicaceae bacterium]|nr:hypothetical protein [Crocinitomicaceae bacterium]